MLDPTPRLRLPRCQACMGLVLGALWLLCSPSRPGAKAPKLRYVKLSGFQLKGMSRQKVLSQLRRHKKRFRALFLRHFGKKNPDAKGVLRLRWWIDSRGKVMQAKVIGSSGLGATFERGLVGIFRRMRFASPLPCGVAVAHIDLHFRMAGFPAKKPTP